MKRKFTPMSLSAERKTKVNCETLLFKKSLAAAGRAPFNVNEGKILKTSGARADGNLCFPTLQ